MMQFKTMWSAGAASIMMLFSVCAAQSSTSIQSSTAKAEPFTINIRPIAETAKSGEPIQFEVTITNVSDHTILVQAWGANPPDAFNVRDSGGNEVVPKTRVKTVEQDGQFLIVLEPELKSGSTSAIELQPGKTQIIKETLPGFLDLSRPGKYSVYAWRPDGLGGTGVVKSNTVTVTITS